MTSLLLAAPSKIALSACPLRVGNRAMLRLFRQDSHRLRAAAEAPAQCWEKPGM